MKFSLVHSAVLLSLITSPTLTLNAVEPLAYYPFDSDLRDYSGNGNHGTMIDADEGPLQSVEGDSGITNTGGEFAVGGGAIHFSTNRDTVSIPVGTLAADTDGWAIAFFSRNAVVGSNLGGMVIGNNTNTSDHIHVDAGSGFRVRQSSGTNATFGIDTEDTLWHHYAVVVEDFDTDGNFDDVTLYKDGVYVNTVLNAAGSGFSATHIGDAYTDQFDFDFYGQIDEVYIFDTAISATKVAELHGSAPDATAPILIEISDDRLGGPVEPGSTVTYTLTFSEDMDASTVMASDFALGGTAGGTIGTITEVSPRFIQVQVTPAAAGSLQLQINQSATLSDPAGNHLDTSAAIPDDTIITVQTDNTAPTLASGDIHGDQSGSSVDQGNTLTYTLTFSEDMDHATIDAADFGNAGTATFTLGDITEISANVFTVEITATSTGTLQLEVLDTALIADAAGNFLDVTGGITANTTITVEPGPLGVTRLRVFLLAGQSNALGSNQIEPSNLPTSPVNLQLPREDIPFYFGGNNVKDSPNPFERVIGLQPLTRFGPEITMGRSLADDLADGVTTQVAIIKYARGATNLYENWKAGGDNTPTGDGAAYQWLQVSVNEGLAALAAKYPNAVIEIEGMLWVQGEWDALELSNAQNYETNLTNFIADVRATYGADLPFVISRLSTNQTYINATSLATVQAAQDAVAAADPWANVFNTDSFELFSDELHFNEQGQQQIGEAGSTGLKDLLNIPTPPQAISFDPADTSTGHLPTDNLSITFDENIAFGTGNISLYQNGVATPIETYDVTNPGSNLSISGDTLTINPTADLNTFTTYYVEVSSTAIEDIDGAAFAGFSGSGTWSFETGEPDTTQPQIQTLSPTNGASNIAVDTNLTITFSEDVVLGIGIIVLREIGGALVESFDVANPPTGLSLNGASLTINPSTDLTMGTTYYVEIPDGAIEDLAGNTFDSISGSGAWSFTTIPPDTTAPSAQAFNPTNGDNNISASANLTITFNEDIAFGTGNLFLFQSGGGLIETFDVTNPGSRLSISGGALTINPTGDLTPNTTYYLEIQDTAIEDLSGNSFDGFSGDGTWSFTTSNPASTILFDFQNDLTTDIATGAVAVNDLSSPVNANGVTLTASVGNNTSSSRDRGANTGPISDITRDFIQWNIASPINITITGLASDQEYSFRLWSGDLAGGQIKTTDHTIAGASGGGTIRHTSVSLTDENATGGSLVEFPNVVATSSGTLTYTIDYVSGGGTAATLNGFELVVVSTDTTAPTLTTTDPTDESTGVSASANLVATFDEIIAAGSGLITIKNLTDATETTINITDDTQVTISDETLTINPTSDLAKGKNYAVRIAGTAIEDASGNAFAGISDDTTWNFTTVAPTYTEWINEQSVGILTGPDDDYDGDDIPNIVENYFGTNPGEPSRGLVSGTKSEAGGNTTFTFTHPLNPLPASDVSAVYRWSTNLGNFNQSGDTVAGTTVTFSSPSAPDTEGIVTVTATISGNTVDRIFIDIEVNVE